MTDAVIVKLPPPYRLNIEFLSMFAIFPNTVTRGRIEVQWVGMEKNNKDEETNLNRSMYKSNKLSFQTEIVIL